jgi:hypothetical protein
MGWLKGTPFEGRFFARAYKSAENIELSMLDLYNLC